MGAAAQPLSERVVLVVDDEPVVCHLVARMLVDAGFHVLEAHSGTEAAGLLSTLNGTVQLVVADVAMPSMTGIELATLMESRWPTTPILLMSGQGAPAGYPGLFLPKPFTVDALLDAVRGLVPLPKH
jgi:DNA-binding response OmpR family regulator